MKNNGNKELRQLPVLNESSTLRMVYKNKEVINDSKNKAGKEKAPNKKAPNKLFVKEPFPLFNDYKFKAKDHDPL